MAEELVHGAGLATHVLELTCGRWELPFPSFVEMAEATKRGGPIDNMDDAETILGQGPIWIWTLAEAQAKAEQKEGMAGEATRFIQSFPNALAFARSILSYELQEVSEYLGELVMKPEAALSAVRRRWPTIATLVAELGTGDREEIVEALLDAVPAAEPAAPAEDAEEDEGTFREPLDGPAVRLGDADSVAAE